MLQKTLKERFDFEQFLPGQQAVIERILSQESALAVFPTGAGKSLCYQLPALDLLGITLVVSPLLSLMKDQLDFLVSKNIPAAKLDSGMPRQAYQAALLAAIEGRIKILMISVERFKNEPFRLHLEKMMLSLMVVDEAHCISEWGHNFRPDYLKLPVYQRTFKIPQVLLLTATATPRVAEDMCQKFGIAKKNVLVTGFYRKNLQLEIQPTPAKRRMDALLETLARPPAGPTIIYVIQQKTAETVASRLVEKRLPAAAYHAGMPVEQRERVQNDFMADRLAIVVATIAFGMGIDKRDIRKVVHYDLPKSIESYSQEIGRAGRDGAPSICSVLADRSCVPLLENFAYGDTPQKAGIAALLQQIRLTEAHRLEIRLYDLSQLTDVRLLPLKTLLVYLEIEQIIKPRYAYFEDYPFKLIESAEKIVDRFKGERREFVQAIFAHGSTAKVWTRPDITAIVTATGSPRRRVLAALDYFDQQGWIDLAPQGSVEVFEILNKGFDLEHTTDKLFALFSARERFEVERIGRMIALFEAPTCLSVALSAYFGETLDHDCGRCSQCRTTRPIKLPQSEVFELSRFDFNAMVQPLLKRMDTPVSATLLTRFLCGISTPKLARIKARKLTGFGSLAGFPYRQVYTWAASHLQINAR